VMTADAASGRIAIYVDGVLNESTQSQGEQTISPVSCIGRVGAPGNAPPVYLKADIDEVRIYGRAVYPGEIVLLGKSRKRAIE
jgi:hypothetical protein